MNNECVYTEPKELRSFNKVGSKEKHEKALKYAMKEEVEITWIKTNKTVYEYNHNFDDYIQSYREKWALTQKEFNLLKEVLL